MPVIGGLTCIFSTSAKRFPGGGEEAVPLRHERREDLGSSLCYSTRQSIGSCCLRRDQSPVAVLRGGSSVQGRPSARVWTNRSVQNTLESCIEHDSSIIHMQGRGIGAASSSIPVDELFDQEIETDSDFNAKELLMGAQSRHEMFSEDLVVKAFHEAEKAHRGQMRASGDTYLQHCVETAVLLALIGANSTVVAAGLLHDTLDDSFTSYDHICKTFGPGVAGLVVGVSKLSQLSKLARDNDTANKTIEADRLHTMFLAMADARAVLIKLADRLHNMITLDALPVAKQQRFATETLQIFAPLVNRLGISCWKDQLEDMCFKHLHPYQHKELSSKLLESVDEGMIKSAIEKLGCTLKEEAVSYHFLSGRHKSLYSIYRKMLKKKVSVSDIHDIHGLRLIVEDEDDCYKALRIVHELWSEIPGKAKDYINHPKFNGYRSLHTVVMGDGMVPLEVQIRTKEMHLQAEFGFAAHWRYKESDCRHSAFVVQMVEWARWLVTWQCKTTCKLQSSIIHGDSIKPPDTFPSPSHSDDCPYSYKPGLGHNGPIFVIMIDNDQMSVQEFGIDATMMDLMERAGQGSSRWMPYGFPLKEELRPRLNNKPVTDPTCKLKMGDVVELSPSIPNESIPEYREEIQRMYGRELTVSTGAPAPL